MGGSPWRWRWRRRHDPYSYESRVSTFLSAGAGVDGVTLRISFAPTNLGLFLSLGASAQVFFYLMERRWARPTQRKAKLQHALPRDVVESPGLVQRVE